MIPKTFETGNYNTLDTFTKVTLPGKMSFIRNDLVGKIDEILENMLGGNTEVQKTEINATLVCTGGKVNGINCDMTYTVEDFQVPTAPNKAVQNDTQAIMEALKVLESVEIKKVTIDIKTGVLYIEAHVPMED